MNPIEPRYPLDQIYAPWLWPEKDLKFLPPRLAESAVARKKALEEAYEDAWICYIKVFVLVLNPPGNLTMALSP